MSLSTDHMKLRRKRGEERGKAVQMIDGGRVDQYSVKNDTVKRTEKCVP